MLGCLQAPQEKELPPKETVFAMPQSGGAFSGAKSLGSAFRDNYLDLPFDLSRAMFITTANSVAAIPRPLQDRMETLQLSGYSGEEKPEIARRHCCRARAKRS